MTNCISFAMIIVGGVFGKDIIRSLQSKMIKAETQKSCILKG
jgi:hypothetical protein